VHPNDASRNADRISIGVFFCGTLSRMSPDLIFRPVRLEDKARILEFTAHTWGDDEDDYIQYVFDDWLNDFRGEFTAGEMNGQVVAIAKLTDTGLGDWWFEGLRVDPHMRGQGIGAALNLYQVNLARQLGGTAIRYTTSSDNVGSQAIGFKTGFELAYAYVMYTAPALDQRFSSVRLGLDDLPALREWLVSPLIRHARGLYRAAWKVHTLTEAALTDLLQTHEVYGLKDRSGRVTAWCVLRPAEEEYEFDRLRIDHIDGEPDAIVQLARSIRELAHQRGKEKVSLSVIDYEPLLNVITQAGYQPHEKGFGMWVMEKMLNSEIVR
jgi:GNAT superfamily N-acetyltransferase